MINVLMSSYKKAKCETFIVNNLIVQVKFSKFQIWPIRNPFSITCTSSSLLLCGFKSSLKVKVQWTDKEKDNET